jgi:hypothetical protein
MLALRVLARRARKSSALLDQLELTAFKIRKGPNFCLPLRGQAKVAGPGLWVAGGNLNGLPSCSTLR